MVTENKATAASDYDRLQNRLHDLEKLRLEDRVSRSEDLGGIKVQMASFDSRISVVEDGVRTLMTHSTWLLRLLIGGIGIAFVQFILEGNFNVIP